MELRRGGSMRLRLLWLLGLGLLVRLGEVRVFLGLHPVDLFQELLYLPPIPFHLLVLEYQLLLNLLYPKEKPPILLLNILLFGF